MPVQAVLRTFLHCGFCIRVSSELILRAEKTGARVREVSAEFRRRESGTAHFGRVNDIAWTLADMIRLRFVAWFRGWN